MRSYSFAISSFVTNILSANSLVLASIQVPDKGLFPERLDGFSKLRVRVEAEFDSFLDEEFLLYHHLELVSRV